MERAPHFSPCLPEHLDVQWARTQQLEDLGLYAQAQTLLGQFLDQLPGWADWRQWALHLAEQAIDHGAPARIRFPLFQRALRPALEEAIQNGHSAACRWLAGFAQFRRDRDQPSPVDLLRLALQRESEDQISLLVLVDHLRSGLDYAFHELPTGILDHTSKAEAFQDIDEYETLCSRAGVLDFECEFIHQARDFTRLYTEYLAETPRPKGFAVFLQSRKHALRINALWRRHSPQSPPLWNRAGHARP